MQFPLAGKHRVSMPSCRRSSFRLLVAGRMLEQLVWRFEVALDSITQPSALLMVLPICFYSSPEQENLYSFIHSRVKPWMKSPRGMICQLFYFPKMNTNHIPVFNHTLFGGRIHMQTLTPWMLVRAAGFWIPLPGGVIPTWPPFPRPLLWHQHDLRQWTWPDLWPSLLCL